MKRRQKKNDLHTELIAKIVTITQNTKTKMKQLSATSAQMRLNRISMRFSLYFSFDSSVWPFSLARACHFFFIIKAITNRNREQRSRITACVLRSWWMSVRSAWSLNIDGFMIRLIRKQLYDYNHRIQTFYSANVRRKMSVVTSGCK